MSETKTDKRIKRFEKRQEDFLLAITASKKNKKTSRFNEARDKED